MQRSKTLGTPPMNYLKYGIIFVIQTTMLTSKAQSENPLTPKNEITIIETKHKRPIISESTILPSKKSLKILIERFVTYQILSARSF